MTALCNFFEERTALFEAMVSWGWDDEDWQEWEQENLSQEELDWIEETENWTDEDWITEGDVDYPMWLWPAGRRWNLQSVGVRGGLPRQRLRLPS